MRCGALPSAPGPGSGPGLFWLSGFNSDMRGTKAQALDAWAARKGRACVRFDYSGHGESGGAFTDGTIGRWLEESLAVFDRFCAGPQVVVGSSMGGWLALLLAREVAKRQSGPTLAGLVLIAPAPDFTEELMWKGLSAEVRAGDRDEGPVAAAVGLWRSLSDHARADRGRPKAPRARQLDQCRLSGSHPAGCEGSGRALAACVRTDLAAAERRRGADADPGRRSPPVAAAGHRAADLRRSGVLILFRHRRRLRRRHGGTSTCAAPAP